MEAYMKYTLTFLLIILLMLTGCAVTTRVDDANSKLELVGMSSLPPQPSISLAGKLRLNVLFRVLNNGTVADVRMLGSSGDSEWDVLAINRKQMRCTHCSRAGSRSTRLRSNPEPGRQMNLAGFSGLSTLQGTLSMSGMSCESWR